MRALGVGEEHITGTLQTKKSLSNLQNLQFLMIRNPLYHWTHHKELSRYFGIDELLSEKNAVNVYEKHQLYYKLRSSLLRHY